MNIIKSIKVFASNLKSSIGGRLTISNPLREPQFFADCMDADRVAYILRSAQGGATQELFALYRDILIADSHIQTELSKRKLAVLGKQFRVLPYDKKSAADVDAATFCEQSVYRLKSWRNSCSALLDGVLWPVAVVEKVYSASGKGFQLDELIPVPYHLLDYTTGVMRIRDTSETGEVLSTYHDPDPERYIVHRGHLLSTADHWGGPMRAIVWWWLLSTMSRDWWASFLEHWGTPFMVGQYTSGQDRDRNILERAFSLAIKRRGVVISKEAEIKLIESARGGAAEYSQFIALCNAEKSKLIIGQTLSATPSATGMGSGVADLQSEVRDDIRQFDAMVLSESIRDQVFSPICRLAGLTGNPPYIAWGNISPAELKAKADILASFYNAGLTVADSGIQPLSDEVGIELQRSTSSPPSMFNLKTIPQPTSP